MVNSICTCWWFIASQKIKLPILLKWVWILCVFIANYFWNIWFDIFESYRLEQRNLGSVFTPTRLIGEAWACPWQMGVQDRSRRERLLWVWEKRKEESEVWDKKEELVGMGNEYDHWEEQRLSSDETSHWPWGPLCEGYYNITILL